MSENLPKPISEMTSSEFAGSLRDMAKNIRQEKAVKQQVEQISLRAHQVAKKYVENKQIEIQGITDIDLQVKLFGSMILKITESPDFKTKSHEDQIAFLEKVNEKLNYLETHTADGDGVNLTPLDFTSAFSDLFKEFTEEIK
jgi:hypothetical protein